MGEPTGVSGDDDRWNLRCAWVVTAIIFVEWMVILLMNAHWGQPFVTVIWIGCVLDILFYWVVAHFMFENHELEFAILPLILGVLAGILIPTFGRARDKVLRHRHAVVLELRRNATDERWLCSVSDARPG